MSVRFELYMEGREADFVPVDGSLSLFRLHPAQGDNFDIVHLGL
ncbi:MAG TPA: hypothetical protein VG297_05495 [Bryobacteraceae bacterium]|jgi:hypothetical protein|nr:hypothetical protein [Bryobacteraceae bacterium]